MCSLNETSSGSEAAMSSAGEGGAGAASAGVSGAACSVLAGVLELALEAGSQPVSAQQMSAAARVALDAEDRNCMMGEKAMVRGMSEGLRDDRECFIGFLTIECIRRDAAGSEAADDKQAAGVLFLGGRVDSGGDEEVGEVRAAEGTGGGFEARERYAMEFVAGLGVEAGNAAAVAEGDPEVAVGINGHAVGRGVDVAGGDGGAEVAEVAVLVIEGEDFAARGVDVKDGFAIGGPDDAIGGGDRTEGFVDAEVGIEAVKPGVTGFADQTHGSGEKPSVWRAFAVVEAVVGFVVLGIGDGAEGAGLLVEEEQAVVAGDKQAAAFAGDDGADALADIPGLFRAVGGIKAMDGVAFDIDKIEGVVPPNRAFAPFAADISNRFGADHGGNITAKWGFSPQQKCNRGLFIETGFWQGGRMRTELGGDVWKVWLYAAASVALGAWISPLLYNGGKALAEVSANKTTNGPLEWLAGWCSRADFADFYRAGLGLAAVLLFFPWMEWIHARRERKAAGEIGPWGMRIPCSGRLPGRGQRLWRNLRGPWHLFAGFLLVAGLMLPIAVALVPAGFFTMRHPGDGMVTLVSRTILGAGVMAIVMEVFFRGVVMGVLLRAMGPAAALGMSAAFFALALMMIPPPGWRVMDPDGVGVGFEVLRGLWMEFADWQVLLTSFVPWLALGGVLAYARWKTASLWLPVGIHTGWLVSKSLIGDLGAAAAGSGSVPHDASLVAGTVLQQGVVPLAAILLAGVLAHFLTTDPFDECAFEP